MSFSVSEDTENYKPRNSAFNQKTQRHKGTKVFPDTKITSDLKVATKLCGRGSPPAPLIPRGGLALRQKTLWAL